MGMRSLNWVAAGLCSLIFSLSLSAQQPEPLRLEIQRHAVEQQKRAEEYAKKNNIPVVSRDVAGNLVVLVGITDEGHPLFETTDNAGAAQTTGVTALREGGSLGLNLQGEGLTVAIWDGGIVDDHIEYNPRILSREGTDEDSHASHVTGTILATGLNPSAMGMAPKAQAFTFDFTNDTPEMLNLARPDQSGIILSNHSYGLITGWRFNSGWQWFGDGSISTQEDYRFGFYSQAARQWDLLANNSPYYLIVKSAGNDRSDIGSGNFPPDCNGGSGYDCISDKGVAKNILTVGAVNKTLDYTGPSSVVMSSFSSWGPTDDGRIKPDIVAAGVGIFSTTASVTNNQYGSLNGTSMAAPNATGSLLLLQELHKNLNGGSYMQASTLKALAIHSAKEAGMNPGPDYQFGWGLLDVEAGAKILLNKDDQNIYVIEETLANNQTFSIPLQPKANTKITATLVWSDPAGTPVAAALDPTDIMLVNDLDLRIRDDANNEQFPWILNPSNPTDPASRGDNIRDNVEKIEFDNPEPRNYTLLVRHKGTLAMGSQSFSLIIEYASLNDPRIAYYWIGGSGNWHTPANWSLSSGGAPINQIPSEQDRVIVDENSFTEPGQNIALTTDASAYSITWLTKNQAGIDLSNHELTIRSGITISSQNFEIVSPGKIRFQPLESTEFSLNLSNSNFEKAELLFEGIGSTWLVTGTPILGTVNLVSGALNLDQLVVNAHALVSNTNNNRTLRLVKSHISKLASVHLGGNGLSVATSNTILESNSLEYFDFNFSELGFNGQVLLSGEGDLQSSGTLTDVELAGDIQVSGGINFGKLKIAENSIVRFEESSVTRISSNTYITSSPVQPTRLISSGDSPAIILADGHYKLCFDNLIINKVNLQGSGVINAGLSSTIQESSNWIQSDCEDVLFPDFSVQYACVGAVTEFIDKTSGIVTNWSWNFGDPTSTSNTSNNQNPIHIYSNPGTYSVTLTASNSVENRSYTFDLEIIENNLPDNSIVLNNDQLFSFRSASSYQWYRNGTLIEGAINRNYIHGGEAGSYFVVTKNEVCSLPSEPYVITSLEERITPNVIKIYPNPFVDQLSIVLDLEAGELASIALQSITGRLEKILVVDTGSLELEVSDVPPGVYILSIRTNNRSLKYKIIKL